MSREGAPPAGVRLCALTDIADPGAKGFDFTDGDLRFAGFVVRRGQVVVGYVDSCPHVGWPLAPFGDRYLTREKDLILCSGHGALFAIDDGRRIAGPCSQGLTVWPVAVRDGDVVTE